MQEWTEELQNKLLEAFQGRLGGTYVRDDPRDVFLLVDDDSMLIEPGRTIAATDVVIGVKTKKKTMAGLRGAFGSLVASIFATAKPSLLAKALLGVKFWRDERWSWVAHE